MIKYSNNHTLANMLKTLQVNSDIKYLNLDLCWCILTVIATAIATTALNDGWFSANQTIDAVGSGVISALIYLQFTTLVIYALSYYSVTIRRYRTSIVAVAIIVLYLSTKVITTHADTVSIYSYSASITSVMIIVFKLKSILYVLIDNINLYSNVPSSISIPK